MLDDKLDNALAELIRQWNIAETRIKKAEQVRDNEVVTSAIFELRYAGRKIIDSIDLCLKHDIAADSAIYERVHGYIADATEDCVKAKHDAIDAMMNFVTLWFRRTEESLGLGKLQAFFPDYLEISAMIADVQDKIASSRGDRNSARDATYDEIDSTDGPYEKVIALFERMSISADRVGLEVRRERREKIALWAVTIVSVVVGVIGIIISLR
jgi:hypothetical protein